MEKQVSVLLIDDDEKTREIFQVVVVEQHQQILVTATSVEDALNELDDFHPDVIVIDLYLPGTNGYQFLEQVRQGELNPHCPIVATTAFHSGHEVGHVLLSGFDGFLEKPLDAATLFSYLQGIIVSFQG
jgi:two-component system cell cycle response regulator DivK